MEARTQRRPRQHVQQENQKRPRIPQLNQAPPFWLIWGVAALALLVILTGIGITTMVIWVEQEQERIASETTRNILPTAEPLAVILPTKTPTQIPPTPTLLPTPAPVSNDLSVVVTVEATSATDRTERPDLLPLVTAERPVITATVVPEGGLAAPQVSVPFVIDGDLEGWGSTPPYVSTFTVYQQTWWDGSDDLDAFWRLAWDSVNLYVSVIVIDDVHVQTQQPKTAYRGDSVEIQIDTDRGGDIGQPVNADDYQIILSPGNFADIAAGAHRFQGDAAKQRITDAPGHAIVVASQKTDDGYVLEAAIPWADLDVRPVDGLLLGIALNASDNDIPGSAVQVIMKSHVESRTFESPDSWGTMVLITDQ